MQNPLLLNIIKLTIVMRDAETYIERHAESMLPEHRELLIDECTISIGHHVDDLFTFPALKQIVTDLVAKHEGHRPHWFVDVDRCTSTEVVVTNNTSKQSIRVPIHAFLMSATPLDIRH